MSDSEDSTVTCTEASPSPDYIPGLKEPERAPPLPDFVPEPVYPEFMPPEDEVLLAEVQPLPATLSPTTNSPGYVPESDLEEDPEEDDEEDPEEDPADYPADEGDDGDAEDESSDDEEDDDVDIEEDHLAPVNSIAVSLPAVNHAPSAEETEPFETDESAATPPPHHAYRVARLLAIPTPPPSPLSPWSSPLPHIPSPPLPLILSPLPVSLPLLVSPPLPLAPPPLLVSPTYPLGYRAAMIWLRAKTPSTSHSPLPHIILSHTREDTPPSGTPPLLPIPAPTSSPSLLLPSVDHGADRPEVCLPPRKRLCVAFGPRYEVRESSSASTARPTGGFRADYGFVATIDREIMQDLERHMTEFATRVRQDTDESYVRLDDEQTERQLMAWGRSMDTSDLARSEVMSLRTTVLADRKRQAQFIKALKLLKRLQTQMTEFESQQGPAKGLAQPDAPKEASSSS
ncbi:hypothetical protein Tco_0900789 [Tanacetum coccineum]